MALRPLCTLAARSPLTGAAAAPESPQDDGLRERDCWAFAVPPHPLNSNSRLSAAALLPPPRPPSHAHAPSPTVSGGLNFFLVRCNHRRSQSQSRKGQSRFRRLQRRSDDVFRFSPSPHHYHCYHRHHLQSSSSLSRTHSPRLSIVIEGAGARGIRRISDVSSGNSSKRPSQRDTACGLASSGQRARSATFRARESTKPERHR
ncbi:hypothetical protein BDZ90DRAFT_11711 [Jaminaea rosea]|uniref:Uncharacterized protein n=1 Tax=Jaminaea rosea TaxID=1569628 RepID=A0A316UYI4_9BASI|nr:hypothetical protein BDZ90DRAFT_11711 [Jaminaea rosea]PWN30360.1 hypothetical protein BDZ90DRAFT_11711 [Jaminaea rosea]